VVSDSLVHNNGLRPYSYQDMEELPIMRKLLFIFFLSGGNTQSLRPTRVPFGAQIPC
jgi:hypothetical protein